MIGIILLGAPGAGKGVLANYLAKKYNLLHVSTGNIFRNSLNSNNEISFLIKKYISNAQLVPDEITIQILEKYILNNNVQNGYIMDGFPRTLNQAQCFNEIIKNNNLSINFVININVKDDILVKRIVNRRVCDKCKISYNLLTMPPKQKDVCDVCGQSLIKRSDDTLELFSKRLKDYHGYADPIINFYKKSNFLFVNLDGSMEINKIFEFISEIIDNCD
jgi:adenylate kinase